MTTQIHKCHPRDTEEQLYDVRLHDVELHDVANVRHKSASSCVPSWLHGNLAHYLMLFPRKAYKHKMPAWVWICTLHGCPPHHVLTNLSLSMYHKQPRRIDWYGLDTKKKLYLPMFFIRVQVWIQKRPDLESMASSPISLSWVDPTPSISACKRASWTASRSFLRLLWVAAEARGRPAARSANFLDEKLSSAWIVSEHLHNLPPSTAL